MPAIKIHKACPACKIDFDVSSSYKNQECCSIGCSGKLRSERTKGKKRPPFSQKWKDNIGKARKGRHLTQEWKDNISKALQNLSPEKDKLWREKLSRTGLGKKKKPLTQEQKDKISRTLTGRKCKPLSQKHKDKISKANRGRSGKKGSDNRNWKPRIHKFCVICGEDFYVKPSAKNQKCCREKCSRKFVGKKISGENNYLWKAKIHKICLICGKNFYVRPCLKDIRKCCSNECRIKFATGENASGYIDGRSYEPYPSKFSHKLKESIRRRDGYICQLCGLPEIGELNSRKLSIHHVDNDTKNNSPDNLITLCNLCNNAVKKNPKKWTRYFQKKLQKQQEQKQLCLTKL